MRLYLWFTLLVVIFISIQSTVDGGLIRRSRRLRRIGPMSRHNTRSARVLNRRKWPHFLAPPRKWGRNLHRVKHQNTEREDRHPNRPGHQLRLPLMMSQQNMQTSASTAYNAWRPLDFGNPKSNFDPIFDYAPPALERVRFAESRRHRKPPTMGMRSENNGKPRPLFNRPRRPSIWKLLATKQRPRRPFNRRPPPPHMHYHGNSNEEAEIFPRIPNIVYFRPADVIPLGSTKSTLIGGPQNTGVPTARPSTAYNTNAPTYRPGKVTSVPLYSREIISPSQFNPVPVQSTTPAQITFSIPKKPDDILYRAQEFMNPTRKPTILQPVKSTPVTLLATRNSAIRPIDPTESLLDVINDPPKPVNSFSIFNSPNSVFASNNKDSDNNNDNNLVVDDDDDDDESGKRININKNYGNKIVEKPLRPSPVFASTQSFSQSPVYNEPIIAVPSDHNDDDDEDSTTLNSVAISTSVSTSTSVLVRGGGEISTFTTEQSVSSSPAVAASSVVETIVEKQKPQYQKLPEMPTYKKRPTPIYPKRIPTIKSAYGSSSIGGSTSSSSKENNGSGEGLVITMARSKVKEYKPQFLSNYTQLLTFDKVAEVEPSDNLTREPNTSSSSLSSAVVASSPAAVISATSSSDSSTTETSTRKSPLEQFDPMKLLHSWFQNT